MIQKSEARERVELVWRCKVEGCDFSAPPTLRGFNALTGHQVKHAKQGIPKPEKGMHLVGKNTGEVFAESLSEAREKGLLQPIPEPSPSKPPPIPPEKTAEELAKEEAELAAKEIAKQEAEEAKRLAKEAEAGEVKPEPKEGKEKEAEITVPQVNAQGVLRYTVTLPADAFTLFNLAKVCDLEKDKEKLFDEFLWDCIRKRFETDWKKQLVLAPLEEA